MTSNASTKSVAAAAARNADEDDDDCMNMSLSFDMEPPASKPVSTAAAAPAAPAAPAPPTEEEKKKPQEKLKKDDSDAAATTHADDDTAHDDADDDGDDDDAALAATDSGKPKMQRDGHDWGFTDAQLEELKTQWRREQAAMAARLVLHDSVDWVMNEEDMFAVRNDDLERRVMKYVGGCDISFVPNEPTLACACLVVLELPDLKPVYIDCEMVTLRFPYMSGFLAFREAPHLVNLLDKLRRVRPSVVPSVILIDGNGVLHPRGFGLACHLGLAGNIPTIGVAKKFCRVEELRREEAENKCAAALKKPGDWIVLRTAKRVVGAGLRIGNSQHPVFVSVGHDMSLETAVRIVVRTSHFRIPEPVRQADLISRDFIRKWVANKQRGSSAMPTPVPAPAPTHPRS